MSLPTVAPTVPSAKPRFKMVCDQCGSLAIRGADFANASAATRITCGRCDSVRGTLEELHNVARDSGSDAFEF